MSNKVVETVMTIAGDRFVTPGVTFPGGTSKVGLFCPTLDDASDVKIEISPKLHNYNYPKVDTDYATAGITAEWRMDDADGTTIVDSVAGLTLTEQGDPTFATSAATIGLGKSVVLDGTGDQFDIVIASVPDGVCPVLGDFSVEVLGKYTSASTGDGDTIISCRTGADGVGWQLQFDANQFLDVHIEDVDGEVAQAGALDIADDTIRHILCSFDRDGNLLTFINGALNATTDISSKEKTILPADGAANMLCIGGDPARTAGDNLFATIYFVRIYNRTVAAAEALSNYNTLMNLGYPGWTPLLDLFDGDDLIVCKSGSAPGYFDLTRHLPAARDYALRAVCATEQTTTPQALTFAWMFS